MNPNTSQNDFRQGLALHQAGRLAEAAACYRRVLEREPGHADAMHLLGLVAFQSKNYPEAEQYVRGAIRLKEAVADFHFNLGLILAEQLRHEEAEKALRRAVELAPHDAGALNNLGNTLLALGKHDEAEKAFRQALKYTPDDPELCFNLGNVLKAAGRFDEAEEQLRRALHLRPDYPEALVNLGVVLRAAKRPGEAEDYFRLALRSKPDYAEASSNLGAVLRESGRLEEAEAALRQDLDARPGHVEGWNNLGVVLNDLGRLEEAEDCFRKALALKPDHAMAHSNLGNVLMDSRRLEESKAAYQAALHYQPDYQQAHWNLGLVYLLEGDFPNGWKEYEWRLERRDLSHLYPHQDQAPLWQGEALEGKTILLYAEQGQGDTLQFVRLAPLVAARGGRVLLECQPSLKRLLQQAEGLAGVYAQGEPLPPFDLQCPLLSLPHRLGLTLDTVPAPVPYLHADDADAARWAARMPDSKALRVGLVWAGEPRKQDLDSNRIDRRRSIALELFQPLFDLEGADFYSLQKGEASWQAWRYANRLTDWTAEIKDFADTAGLIAQLDLVISVDTSVAHLAGAMGKPVWMLSRFDGCWRWLLERDDSPWYPTLRLFRQERPGNWEDVIARVRGELDALVRSR